jgi:hypothetical protein
MLLSAAYELMANRGKAITLKSSAGGSYNTATSTFSGATVTDQSMKGCILNYSSRDRADGLILEGDRKAVLAAKSASLPPRVQDQITYYDHLKAATVTCNIVEVQVIEDKGVAVAYVCQIREA